MRLIASRQLTGDWGTVTAGQGFDVPPDIAKQLLESGVANIPPAPKILYETKVVTPEAPEVSPRPPFRDVPVSHAASPSVAPKSHSVLPAANLPGQRTTDSGRRGKRNGPRS